MICRAAIQIYNREIHEPHEKLEKEIFVIGIAEEFPRIARRRLFG